MGCTIEIALEKPLTNTRTLLVTKNGNSENERFECY